jgi:hypothetical protein
MRITTKILGLLALIIAFTTAAVAAPANSTRIPGASAKGEYKIAASNQVCCQVGDDEDWSPSWQSCLGHLGKVVGNNVCADDRADDDDGGPDDGVDDDDGGPDDGVDDGGPDDGKDD